MLNEEKMNKKINLGTIECLAKKLWKKMINELSKYPKKNEVARLDNTIITSNSVLNFQDVIVTENYIKIITSIKIKKDSFIDIKFNKKLRILNQKIVIDNNGEISNCNAKIIIKNNKLSFQNLDDLENKILLLVIDLL